MFSNSRFLQPYFQDLYTPDLSVSAIQQVILDKLFFWQGRHRYLLWLWFLCRRKTSENS